MKKIFQNEWTRYLCGLLAGALLSAAIINWSPAREPVPVPQVNDLYSVLSLTNSYSIVLAPLTWPGEFVQSDVNFGCSSDSEVTGCYGTMTDINAGRIYLTIVLSLYLGLIFLYSVNAQNKSVSDIIQTIVFVFTLIALFGPFYILFPEIVAHNSSSLVSQAILLMLMYLPAGLVGIYQIILAKAHHKQTAYNIGWTMFFLYYALSLAGFMMLQIANGF